jgi:hypothetical protein
MYPTKRNDNVRITRLLHAARASQSVVGVAQAASVVRIRLQHTQFCSGDRICYHGVADIFRIPKPAVGVYRSQCDPQEEIVLEPAFDWSRGDRNSFNVA